MNNLPNTKRKSENVHSFLAFFLLLKYAKGLTVYRITFPIYLSLIHI